MLRADEINRILVKQALRKGATDALAITDEVNKKMIRFSNNDITVSKLFSERSTLLHVRIKARKSQSSTTILSRRALEQLVEKTIYMARNSPEGDVYAPLPKGPFKYDKTLLKGGKLDYSDEELVDFVQQAVNAAVEEGCSRVAGTLVYQTWTSYLKSSSGVSAKASGASIEISVRAFANGDATGHFVSVAADKKDFTPVEAGRKAGEIARISKNPTPGEPGEYEAILGPMIFADLVEEVGTAASAFEVDTGLSFLTDRLGEAITSEKFSLIDDPTLAGTYGATPFDHEGVPTRRNTIIEKGTLRTYLHNSTTAKKFNTETTANAGLISPSPFNLIIEPGSKNFEELISNVDKGIWITNDWYLRYQNMRSGDFSTIPRDGMFLIRNGSIEKPIKELRISDNMLRIFRNILELSRERYWITWWEVDTPVLAPYAHVSSLNFMKSTL
ncbi:MAG TPA: TldD/PmbA family protein [Candidatus Caldiarchaeum subterraneum]|uniref:TldD/PmbA family protein n=1 Tax=Caldiarchaeum subterraneum TaxID=311458 RepID=A0A833E9H4_CALS0|nr:TldD/PmbA family protein [Candidatus Caldarchaeum subterraneum]